MSGLLRRPGPMEGLDFAREHLLPGLPVVLTGAILPWPALAWTPEALAAQGVAAEGWQEVPGALTGDLVSPSCVPLTPSTEAISAARVWCGALPPQGLAAGPERLLGLVAGAAEVQVPGVGSVHLVPGDLVYVPGSLGAAVLPSGPIVLLRWTWTASRARSGRVAPLLRGLAGRLPARA